MIRDRAALERWRQQQRLMQPDLATGIDRRVLDAIGDHSVSSHNVVTRDGVRVSYKTFGAQGHPIAFCNGLGGTYRTYGDVIAHLLPEHRSICHDYRGLFESARLPPGAPMDVVTHAHDLIAVLDHAGVPRCTLFGWSMGVQVAMEAWRLQPDRFDALVLASGVEGGILGSVGGFPGAQLLAPGFVRFMRDWSDVFGGLLSRACHARGVTRAARAVGLVGRNAEITMEHAALLFSADPDVYWRMVELLDAHDAGDLLDRIDIPVLILHGDSDRLAPVHRGVELRTRLRTSEIFVFGSCTHAVILEYPERVAEKMREFLLRRLRGGLSATRTALPAPSM